MPEVGRADSSGLLQSRRVGARSIRVAKSQLLRQLGIDVSTASSNGGVLLPNRVHAIPPKGPERHALQTSDFARRKHLSEPKAPLRRSPSADESKGSFEGPTNVPIVKPTPTPPSGNVIKKALPPAVPTPIASSVQEARSPPSARPSLATKSSTTGTPSRASQKPSQSSKALPRPPPPKAVPIASVATARASKDKPNGVSSASGATRDKTPTRGSDKKPSTETTRIVKKPTPVPIPAIVGSDRAQLLAPKAIAVVPKLSSPVKAPSEPIKSSDVVSSPASSAHSPTTPAVHDESTVTSPDHDGPQESEVGRLKPQEHSRELRLHEKEQQQGDQDVSSEARPSQTFSGHRATLDRPKVAEILEKGGPVTSSAVAQPAVVATKPAVRIETKDQGVSEVLDSEGGKPEVTNRGVMEAKTAPNVGDVLSSRDLGVPARHSSSTPLPVKKESPQPPAPDRAVTRVSSGAMRLKSVDEIVAGAPWRPSSASERNVVKEAHDQLTPVTSTPRSPASRARHGHKRSRSKGHVSTVLFGKPPKKVEQKSVVPSHRELLQASDDYYSALFIQNFTGATGWMQPLEKMLFTANKTIMTPDADIVIEEQQSCRVLRRVYHLQQADKWSLRQPKRSPEPTRTPTHWDELMKEMKWMRTDFREERKWKMAISKNLAHACASWHRASDDERRQMQVATVTPARARGHEAADTDFGLEAAVDSEPTPDLVPSGDADSPQVTEDETADDYIDAIPPSALFTLQEDDVVFGLRRTKASDALLDELPMYGAPLKVLKADMTNVEYDPDSHWRRPALPLSKYVEGEMKLVSSHLPRKRGRFEHENEESDDERDGTFAASHAARSAQLPPSTTEVSLFHPDSKDIRDRLHAGHQFRPPSDDAMPGQTFYECRGPSQWTLTEDDELRSLVREHSYNWSLISGMVSSRSHFQSGAERRTPWECFERWLNLEGLPADMQKTNYFKAYYSRIEAAQRVIAQQNQAAAQQANASGGAVAPIRRRPSTPFRVDRRRNQKHLTLIDAIRKLAKKRETALQKQQHLASQSAANKKPNDSMLLRPKKTPREYSLMRHERDQAVAEKIALHFAQRQEAQRRSALQPRSAGQATQAAAAAAAAAAVAAASVSNGVPNTQAQQKMALMQGNSNAQGASVRPNVPTQLSAASAQSRARAGIQSPATAAGAQPNVGVAMSSQLSAAQQAQQAQSQAARHSNQRMSMPNQPPDANLMMRAQRMAEQQRVQIQQAAQIHPQQQQQQQQQQQPQQQHPQQQSQPHQQQQGNFGAAGTAAAGQHASPVNAPSMPNFLANVPSLTTQCNGSPTTSNTSLMANGTPKPNAGGGPAVPPAAHRALPGLPPLVASQLAHLEQHFKTKNPNLPPEQIRQMATEQVLRMMMAQRQPATTSAAAAVAAAAAAAAAQPGFANGVPTISPQHHAALLRQQQARSQQQTPVPLPAQRASSHASPGPASAASPAASHQRQSSGSVTPGGQ